MNQGYRPKRESFLILALCFFCAPVMADDIAETEVIRSDRSRRIEITPQMSIVNPSSLHLANDEYDIPYSDAIRGIPTFSLEAGLPIVRMGDFGLSLRARAGYGYKEGTFLVLRRDGSQSTETIRLHSIPLSAGLRLHYHLPGLSSVKPAFQIGLGNQRLHQMGSLPDLRESIWIPFIAWQASVTFFDPIGASNDWFGGFTFGITNSNSINSSHTMRSWSFDLALNILI